MTYTVLCHLSHMQHCVLNATLRSNSRTRYVADNVSLVAYHSVENHIGCKVHLFWLSSCKSNTDDESQSNSRTRYVADNVSLVAYHFVENHIGCKVHLFWLSSCNIVCFSYDIYSASVDINHTKLHMCGHKPHKVTYVDTLCAFPMTYKVMRASFGSHHPHRKSTQCVHICNFVWFMSTYVDIEYS